MKTLDEMLFNIPWDRLEGVDGPLTDVPKLVKDLGSLDADVRDGALWGLREVLNHQGSVCEACAHLVEPLLFLLQSPGFSGREEVMDLLFQFSRGSGLFTAHQNLSIVKDMYGPETVAKEVAAEAKWLAHLQGELAKGTDCFLTLLDDPSASIRKRALPILGRLRERKAGVLARMKHLAASDPDPETRDAAKDWVRHLEKE